MLTVEFFNLSIIFITKYWKMGNLLSTSTDKDSKSSNSNRNGSRPTTSPLLYASAIPLVLWVLEYSSLAPNALVSSFLD